MPRIARPIAASALALFVCAPVFADTYKTSRTSDGQPDLQGYWTNATLTPVERPASLGEKLVLSEAEATAMEGQMARRMEAANAPSDPNEVQRAGQAVGGYNMFWADFGTRPCGGSTISELRRSPFTIATRVPKSAQNML